MVFSTLPGRTCSVLAVAALVASVPAPRAGAQSAPALLVACPQVGHEGDFEFGLPRVIVYGHEGEATPRLRAVASERWQATDIEVTDGSGALVLPAVRASKVGPRGRPQEAWCGDLNGDGALDFIVPLQASASGNADLVIALSSHASYRVWVAPSVSPTMEDVTRSGETTVLAVRRRVLRGNDAEDGAAREQVTVTNLLGIEGDRVSDSDGRLQGFPALETARDAVPLSAGERDELLRRHGRAMVWEAPPAAGGT